MYDVPSVRAVSERLGPASGHTATVYLVEVPDADFPRELRPNLVRHIEENLPQGGEVSERVPQKPWCEGAFAEIVLVGIKPSDALRLVREIKSWFFQNMLPASLRRDERRRRKERREHRRAERRRFRHNGKQECYLLCRQQMAVSLAR